MADCQFSVVETHIRKHMARLNCYPQSYGAELSKAFSAIYNEYEMVFGHSPKYDDTIKVVTSDDDIILYFEEEIKNV